MSIDFRRGIAILVALFFSVHASGYYKTVAVKPKELPKVNHAYTETTGTARSGDQTVAVTESSTIRMERVDGRLYEVVGDEIDVLLRPKGGDELFFKNPIEAHIVGDALEIKSSNYAEKTFQLDDVESVKVRHIDTELMVGLGVLGSFLLIGALSVWAP